jgi:hypothetical protein
MILLFGIPSEPSLRVVADALDALGTAPYRLVNQRHVHDLRMRVEVTGDGGVAGDLHGPGWTVDLAEVTGVYLRLMDDRELPEVRDLEPDDPARERSRALHDLIGQWADVTPARVVNRYAAMGSNFSKPYQAQLITEHGFATPETLVTNDPDAVRAFAAEHGPLVYKSISGARSIVTTFDPGDTERLERIRWCPVQFQGYVGGPNVRVHTVGDEVHATHITTDAVDYRYASRQVGAPAELVPYDLDEEIAQRCVALARTLGLDVAGLDLKLPPDGRVVCLEVNPSPVFSYYQAHTGQPIADAVARLLAEPVAQPLAA